MKDSGIIVSVLAAVMVWASLCPAELQVSRRVFGTTDDGQDVHLFTLSNSNNLSARIMTLGATLIGMDVPDRQGTVRNVTLHLDTLDDYLKGHPLFGSIVGRFANRIKDARFTIDGKRFELSKNAGPNHIHGGRQGFQKVHWTGQTIRASDYVGVRLVHTSPDGHAGYPGELSVQLMYELNDRNELIMEFHALTTKPTHVNLTNHAYWNLSGAGVGNVLAHRIHINADHYLPTDERVVPTGTIKPVIGTPLDFRTAQAVGDRIGDLPRGYDHCFVLNKAVPNELSLAARVIDPGSGRIMEVFTTQPGVQLYTAYGLSNRFKSAAGTYDRFHGLCLETQHFPNSPNQPNFPSTLLRPGETYRHRVIHRFSIDK